MKNKLKANLYQYLCITPAMLRTMRLCYKTERNQIVLTEEMTDDFDLERMVNGDPKCWFASRPVLGDELKKKIIISDWSFIHPSILQPTEYKLRLSLFYTLLAKDFELFIWNNGLIKINSLLELIQQLSQVSPAHLDTIWEYLRDLHDREFELDKVAILDESQTRKFLNLACAGELSNENELDLFCWRELPLAKIKSIIASLDVANEFTVKLSGYHEDISDTIRMVQARVELRKLVLSGDYWNILCRSHAQMAEKIFSDIFTAPWYASIQQLGFEGINLDEFSRFVLGKQWLPPSLTEWTSTNVTASVQTLSVLLPNSPALRVKVYDKETFSQAIMEVTIAKLRDVVINSRFDLIKFREEIDKSDDLHYDCLVLSIGDEAYEKYHTDGLYILEKLASLKSLKIDVMFVGRLPQRLFAGLKELEIKEKITTEKLAEVINNCVDLVALHVHQLVPGQFSLSQHSALGKLESLNINLAIPSFSHDGIKVIRDILSYCDNLQTLTLFLRNLTVDAANLPNFERLAKLEVLTFNNITNNPDVAIVISTILAVCENVNTLSFEFADNKYPSDILSLLVKQAQALSGIEYLRFESEFEYSFGFDSFSNFWDLMPNLKSLNFDFEIVPSDTTRSLSPKPSLLDLTLERNQLTAKILLGLLVASPNLHQLSMKSCYIKGSAGAEECRLPMLQSFICDESLDQLMQSGIFLPLLQRSQGLLHLKLSLENFLEPDLKCIYDGFLRHLSFLSNLISLEFRSSAMVRQSSDFEEFASQLLMAAKNVKFIFWDNRHHSSNNDFLRKVFSETLFSVLTDFVITERLDERFLLILINRQPLLARIKSKIKNQKNSDPIDFNQYDFPEVLSQLAGFQIDVPRPCRLVVNGIIDETYFINKKPEKFILDDDTEEDPSDVLTVRDIFRPKPHLTLPHRLYITEVYNSIDFISGKIIERFDWSNASDVSAKIKIVDNIETIYQQEYEHTDDYFIGDDSAVIVNYYQLPLYDFNDKLLCLQANIPVKQILFLSDPGLYRLVFFNEENKRKRLIVKFISKIVSPEKPPFLNENLQENFELHLAHLSSLRILPDMRFDITSNEYKMLEKLTAIDLVNCILHYGMRFKAGKLEPIDRKLVNKNSDKMPAHIAKINTLIQQRLGGCEYRSYISFVLLQFFLVKFYMANINFLLLKNDCHSFLAIKFDNRYYKVDLGGFRSKLQLKKTCDLQELLQPNEIKKLASAISSVQPAMQEVNSSLLSQVDSGCKITLRPDNPFITWAREPAINFTNPNDYLDWFLSQIRNLPEAKRNGLIVAQTKAEVLQLNWFLLQYAHTKKLQYHYVDLAQVVFRTMCLGDEAETKAMSVDEEVTITHQKRKAHDNSSQSKRRKGNNNAIMDIDNDCIIPSRTVQFFQSGGDIALLNWANDPTAIAYLTTTEDERRLRDVPIHPGLIIIWVILQHQAAEMAEDFYSRIDPNMISLLPRFDKQNEILQEEIKDLLPIQLYEDDQWQSMLAEIELHGQEPRLKPGKFMQALLTSPGVKILNPKQNDKFRLFLDEFKLTKSFYFFGKTYQAPNNFIIQTRRLAYQVPNCFDVQAWNMSEPQVWDYVLNPYTYSWFFKTHRHINEELYKQPGWLEQHARQKLRLLVTEQLEESRWAKLLDKAVEHGCYLELIFTATNQVPAFFNRPLLNFVSQKSSMRPLQNNENLPQVSIIITNSPDSVLKQLYSSEDPSLIFPIDVSKQYVHVIERIVKKPMTENTRLFNFQRTVGSVWSKLSDPGKKQKVVLVVEFSPELAGRMASVLHQKPFLYVNGEIVSFAHELVIITTQTDLWPFATSRYQQFYINSQYWANASATVSLQHDKVTEIKNLIKDMQADNLIGQLDSVQIETLLRQAKTNEPYAEHAIRKAFKHQFRLAPEGQAITQWLNQRLPKSKANVATDCEQFDKHVLDKIVESLKTNPYVFVMGDSGVGKTTFISKYLKPHYQRYYGRKINLFIGEDSLSDYIVAPKNELNILFLDEANIEKDGYWDRFEALFYKISGIADLIFHQLDPQNFKFIFAGNQSSTHGRNPHRFFNRHGHVRVFPHFPDFYLAERIILPLLKKILPKAETEWHVITEIFLNIYNLTNRIIKNYLITPRNLTQMVLRLSMFMDFHAAKFNDNIKIAAVLSGFDEVRPALKKQQRTQFKDALLATLEEKQVFKQICQRLKKDAGKMEFPDFKLTKSRYTTMRLLQDFLRIRLLCIQHDLEEGVRGFLIEGAAGIGKDALALKALQQNNMIDGRKQLQAMGCDKYYFMTPTEPDYVCHTLLKGLSEGSVSVVSELNIMPAELEKIFNAVLSGIDLKGEVAKSQRFSIIATQNPLMSNGKIFVARKVLSKPLQNRFYKTSLSDYPREELEEIAFHILKNPELAMQLVDDYCQASQYAKIKRLHPEPRPRNLINKLSCYKGLEI